MKILVLAATALSITTTLGVAADAIVAPAYEPAAVASDSPRWFIDAGVGGAWSNASVLHFINPIGTAFTDNDVSGERIHLNDVDKKDSSVGAVFSAGYMLAPNYYIKGSYRYFGKHNYSGNATFSDEDYDQDLRVRAQGIFVGAGYIHDLTDRFYVDAFGEIGASFLKTSAKQGVNLYPDDYSSFPSKSQTNFAGGLGLGVGYKITSNVDFTVTGTYHWLGKAETNKTLNVQYMNDGEMLKAKNIGVAGVTAGIRVKF